MGRCVMGGRTGVVPSPRCLYERCTRAKVVVSQDPSDVPPGSPLAKYAFLLRNGAKMMVPAAIYLVMNILGFVALENIDAATFAMVAQARERGGPTRSAACSHNVVPALVIVVCQR